MKRIFISDCEGPISKNDNAYEMAANFIPNGDSLFSNISKYDDALADVLKKPDYSAGSTLKLILPFFKAYGMMDRQMDEFSANNILLIADSQTTLHHAQAVANAFIVSTSYEHYIKVLCKAVSFPYKNTYCTRVNLDKVAITPQEKERVKEIAQEIAQMNLIDIPPNATNIEDFSHTNQAVIQRLDEIFWEIIPKMFVGKFLTDIVTIGGEQKAESVRNACKRLAADLSDVMYVGDSITDVEAFKLVRNNGGLTLSFNGNNYAVKSAEVAVIAESNIVTAVITDLFSRFDKKETIEVIEDLSFEALKKSNVDSNLLKKLSVMVLPKAQIVTAQNMESLTKESSEFRKKVRGIAISRLG